ncbi:MAG TPA: hypothetical protein VFO76_05695, partial [Candidatus Kapabacteria bacterium]|nr:hypothetical protein [Candidatus Kapabacteria bacterium]
MKKSVLLALLAGFVFTGCYTQVKSTGDYWGYSGRHRRAILVESDTTYTTTPPQQQQDQNQAMPYDSAAPQDYAGHDMIVNNYYEVDPWDHYYYEP